MATNLSSLKVVELKEECRRLGLKTSGKKMDLILRLEDANPGGNKKRSMNYDMIQQQQQQYHHHSSKQKTSHHHSTQQAPSAPTPKQMQLIDTLFNQFEDEDNANEINDDGMLSLCNSLEIEPDDIAMLVLSWYMKAKTMCTFTREEFRFGCTRLNLWNLDGLKSKLGVLRKQISSNDTIFSAVYQYAYDFGKDSDQKSITKDVAVAFWELLLPYTKFELKSDWIEFIKSREKLAVISRDVWKQLLEFTKQILPDLSNFDEDGAWPVLLDEFVSSKKQS